MSTTLNDYALNADVRCSVVFVNNAGAEADPTTVTFFLHDSEGEVTELIYLTDVELVRTAAGRYYVVVDANKPGRWTYRFESTGAVKAADEKSFTVRRSVF